MWRIYKGARVLLWGWTSRTSEALAPHYFIKLCTFKPLPLIEKEKRESPATPLVCHSKPPIKGEELLLKTPKGTTSDSDRASAFAKPQNDKLGYPQGKPTHNKHLQRKLVCHSEGARSATEESLKESLVAKRDSSVVTLPLDMTIVAEFLAILTEILRLILKLRMTN
ncbi:hypothetical protein CQA63_00160 [Helicobacter marmotae]|uniref:Uncharacterized protein n=1 Tax=Helicobacter marmotae TaxID=152490 RepID=A0A3D8I8T4_9HELI|nr:hypothetical protein CQA63_00160 [Helicobacter marmotae]